MRTMIALTGAVVMVLVAGCDSHGDSSSSAVQNIVDPLPSYASADALGAAVVDRQKSDSTAHLLIKGTINGAPSLPVDGIASLRPERGGTALELSEQAQRPDGKLVAVSLVTVGTDVYLKPPSTTALPANKTWQRITPNNADPFDRQFVPLAAALRTYANPTAMFAIYGPSLVLTSGVEDPVEGTRAVRFDLRVNPPNSSAGPPVSTVQMWLDTKSRVLRIRVVQRTPGLTLDMHYDDWGDRVVVKIPKPATVSG